MPVSLLLTTFVVSEGGVPKEMKVEHAAQGADRRVARSGDPRIAFAIDHFVMAVTSSGMGVRGVRDLRRECGTSSHGGITGAAQPPGGVERVVGTCRDRQKAIFLGAGTGGAQRSAAVRPRSRPLRL